jgi:HSP20 family protein
MKDIDLQVQNGTVTLKGERKFEQEQNGRGYHRIDRGYGSFVCAFTMPDRVDMDKVKAQYSGVLTVTLSRRKSPRRRSFGSRSTTTEEQPTE